jgi:hypothetical protein
MTGGLTDRSDAPYGTWQFRFIDWFRALGFLQKNRPAPAAGRGVRELRRSVFFRFRFVAAKQALGERLMLR